MMKLETSYIELVSASKSTNSGTEQLQINQAEPFFHLALEDLG